MTLPSANSSNNWLVATFPVGPLQCNCSIVADPVTGEAAVIDPGGDAEQIIDFLEKNNLKAKYLLHTHAHFDHILGTAEVSKRTGAQICVHKKDEWLYQNLAVQGAFVGWNLIKEKTLDIGHYLEDQEELKIGNINAKVIHTPGHTPGSTCFNITLNESILFAGDTLFQHSIGRTDLWGGSMDEILKSIHNKLLPLDDSTKVIAGHGPDTSIFEEKRHNPFLA